MHPDAEDSAADRLVEARLMASRPRPHDAFVESLEARLFAPTHRRLRPSPRWAAALAAAGTAAALLLAGLFGGGPLAPGGSDGARGTGPCRLVATMHMPRVPVLVRGAHAVLEVRYEERMVRRPVRRCR